MKHKRVYLPMHHDWTLDIYIGNYKKVEAALLKRGCNIELDHCNGMVWSYKDKKGYTRMSVFLERQRDYPVIAHEGVHILYAAEHYLNYEINKDSQEWQACFLEWFVRTVLSIK